ncbi:hypothetical protein NOMA109596_18865 [Nocardioides marinus]
MVSPASWPLPSLSSIADGVTTSLIDGAPTTGVDDESLPVTVAPPAVVPVAVAVLSTLPLSTSMTVSV